jgi:hypothetical protein
VNFTAMKKRRTEIVVETDEIVLRRVGASVAIWCAECGSLARMIAPEGAMAVTGASSREVYRWVEAGQVHFLETVEGFLLICSNSLPTRAN